MPHSLRSGFHLKRIGLWRGVQSPETAWKHYWVERSSLMQNQPSIPPLLPGLCSQLLSKRVERGTLKVCESAQLSTNPTKVHENCLIKGGWGFVSSRREINLLERKTTSLHRHQLPVMMSLLYFDQILNRWATRNEWWNSIQMRFSYQLRIVENTQLFQSFKHFSRFS